MPQGSTFHSILSHGWHNFSIGTELPTRHVDIVTSYSVMCKHFDAGKHQGNVRHDADPLDWYWIDHARSSAFNLSTSSLCSGQSKVERSMTAQRTRGPEGQCSSKCSSLCLSCSMFTRVNTAVLTEIICCLIKSWKNTKNLELEQLEIIQGSYPMLQQKLPKSRMAQTSWHRWHRALAKGHPGPVVRWWSRWMWSGTLGPWFYQIQSMSIMWR